MNSLWQTPLWQTITLSNVSLTQWRQHVYLARWIGAVASWRGGSWILQWGEALAAILVAAILAMSPFVSTGFLGFFLGISAVFWLLLTLADDTSQGWTPTHVTILAFWGVAVVASAFAPEKALGLKGLKTIAFSEGITKLSLYLLFFAMLARLFRSARLRSWILSVYLHVSLFVSIFGVHQAIFGAKALATWVDPLSPLAKTTRAYSYLGNPNVLAAYLLPAIAFSIAAIFVWQGKLPKLLAGFMVFINLWCMYATQSRGGWIAAIVLLILAGVMIYYWFRPELSPFWRRWLIPMTAGATVLLVGGALLVVPSLRERFGSIFAARGDSSNSFRLNVWQAVQQMIKKRPLLGIGYGDRVFKKVYPIYQVNPKISALSAYSIYFETIVETGFIGLISFLWIMLVAWWQGFVPLYRLRQSGDRHYFWLVGGLAGSIGLAVQGFFDTVWYRPEINILWWLTLALMASFFLPPLVLEPAESDRP